MKTPKMPTKVAAVFETYSKEDSKKLLDLRSLVFETAANDKRIGTLEETLKWGEPAYLTTTTKAGSTVRLGLSKQTQNPTVFVSCSTPLIQRFQKEIDYDKSVLDMILPREISVSKQLDDENRNALQQCIAMTLTYHLDKRKGSFGKKASPGKKRKR